VRIGVAHHFGWAVAVTTDSDFNVVDRRRIELIEPGHPAAPIHHVGGPHQLHRNAPTITDHDLSVLVAAVKVCSLRTASAEFDRLASDLPCPIESISVRAWPDEFPTAIEVLRNAPYESRADSVMYCAVLAQVARQRGWSVHRFDAKTVEAQAIVLLGSAADGVLHGPRQRLGPPWTVDHRVATAATVVAAANERR